MNVNYKILCLLSFSLVYCSGFTLQNDSATIFYDDRVLTNPFLGGINYARIEWVDWDYDGDSDLFILDEDRHIKYLENIGTSTSPKFYLRDYHELMEIYGMGWFFIDDFNDDGVWDLVCQSLSSPEFVDYYTLVGDEYTLLSSILTHDGNHLESSPVMTPTFADIDADGDLDFFTGNILGTVNYYENLDDEISEVPVFEFISDYWQDILIIGPSQGRHGASAINFIDLDSDGDLDLSWGDYFQSSLYIVWNLGTSSTPDMDHINLSYQYPPDDPVYTAGQNMPSFADLDGDMDNDLYVTVLGGDGGIQLSNNFYYYENTGNSQNPIYDYVTDDFLNTLDLLSDSAPTLLDIDSDGDLDLFIGQDYVTSTFPIRGRIFYFENLGGEQLSWTLVDPEFMGNSIGTSLTPAFADIDADGDSDLFVGNFNGSISFFRNNGNENSQNLEDGGTISDIDLSFYSAPELVDIDSDGDLDLFVGTYDGNIYFFENIGSPQEFNFSFVDDSFFDINVGNRSTPDFFDIDSDGDYDMVIGSEENNIELYWNIGSEYSPNFLLDSCFEIPFLGSNLKTSFSNSEDDSMVDMFVGLSTGGLLHYKFEDFSGDVNGDFSTDVTDVVYIVNQILDYSTDDLLCLCDKNHDQVIDLLDIILLINSIVLNL